MEETVSSKKSSSGSIKTTQKKTEPVVLKDISLSSDERQSCGIGELDRVLGGGIVPGSLVLVGGDPGIGKSTLLLQVCRNLSSQGISVLYISARNAGMNRPNGWGSVLHVRHGIHLWRKRFLLKKPLPPA